MSTFKFYQLDVFTDVPLTGNALAVFPDAEGMAGDVMQRVAREMNLSETTFVLPSERATRHVRIFTPNAELPLAGHPTIGTWWLLAERGMIEVPNIPVYRITQEVGAGILPVDVHLEHGRPTRVVMVQTLPEFLATVDDAGELSAALGAARDHLIGTPPPQVVSTALPQLMIPFRSLEALTSLPSGGMGGDLAAVLKRFGTDCAMCYWMESTVGDNIARCRMFAPGLGVPEDPATGSAAGALGAYLVRHQLVTPRDGTAAVTILQGAEINRPSTIHVEVDVDGGGSITEVRVGGTAVTVISGEVSL